MTDKPISPFASEGNGQPLTMSTLEIAELTDKRHDNVMRDARKMLAELHGGDRLLRFEGTVERSNPSGGAPILSPVLRLPKRETLVLVSGYSTELRARIIDRWMELEDAATKVGRAMSFPDFTNPVAAARAWADQFEARQLAENTKAEIGTRREATAMNTASQAVKRAIRLEVELDRARSYATVKRMSLLHHGQEFNWRLLKRISEEEGIPPIDVFDANYGTVKAYHAEVWQAAYALVIPERDEDAADAIMPKRGVAQA